MSMFSPMNLTLPSQSPACTPPTCRLRADVAWGPFNAAMLQFIRTQRSGTGGSSALLGGLDLPLSETTTISSSIARGLTRGAKDTTLEIEEAIYAAL